MTQSIWPLVILVVMGTTGGVLVSFGTFISLFAGIGWGMVIFSEFHTPMVWLAVIVLVSALALVTVDAMQSKNQSTFR